MTEPTDDNSLAAMAHRAAMQAVSDSERALRVANQARWVSLATMAGGILWLLASGRI